MLQKQADMAQAVAHLIGSEEVPGPSPGVSSSSETKHLCRFRSFFICYSAARSSLKSRPFGDNIVARSQRSVGSIGRYVQGKEICIGHARNGFFFYADTQ